MNQAVDNTLRHIRTVQDALRAETAAQTRLTYILETTSVVSALDLKAKIERNLNVDFSIEPMFPEEHASGKSEDDELAHFHELHIFGLEHGDLPESPFELGYYLRDTIDLRSVEPDIETDFANATEPNDADDQSDRESALLGGCWVDKQEPQDKSWALDNMKVIDAWKVAPPSGGKKRGAGVLIGHIDTGINTHSELDEAALDIRAGANFVEGGENFPIDPLTDTGKFKNPGHGISTASVIVSRQDKKITGSATQAKLLPIRAIRSVVRVTQGRVTKAVNYARRQGVDVITMSLGGLPSRSLKKAIKRAVKDNILVMAAAGNCVGFVVHPAAQKHCIAIAGTNIDDRPWQGSSHGKAVDVSAPAELVWRAKRQKVGAGTDEISGGQGTSFAVALVAGVAALWLAHHDRDKLIKSLGQDETLQDRFRSLLRSTARRPSHGQWNSSEYGAGIVDAEALLKASPKAQAATESLILATIDEDETFTKDVPELVARATGHEFDDLGLNLAERQRYGLELAWLAYNKAQNKLRPGTPTETAVIEPIASPSLRVATRQSVSAPIRSLISEVASVSSPSTNVSHPDIQSARDDRTPGVPVSTGESMELTSISNTDHVGITESAVASNWIFREPEVHEGYEGYEQARESNVTKKMLVKSKRSEPVAQKMRRPGPVGAMETVFGPDGRERVRETEEVPWRRICSLRIKCPKGTAKGTGWLAGPRTLITAGHCIYDSKQMGGWASEITVIPGRDDDEAPFDTTSALRFSTVRRWVNGQDPDYDLGAIHLDESIGDRLGWFSVASLPDEDLLTQQINIAGYPDDRGDGAYLLHDANRILYVDDKRIYYDVDTFRGQSGSPVWIYRSDNDFPMVVGIHAYGEFGTSPLLNIRANSAPRLNPAMIRQVKRWVQADNDRD
ncbi:MAG: S8 family serine peptidase [Pseudomonadota bacterium]